jgi:hypothetical protein
MKMMALVDRIISDGVARIEKEMSEGQLGKS